MNAGSARTPSGQKDRVWLIAAGSLAALATLIGIAVLSYRSIDSFQDRAQWVERTRRVLSTTELIFSDLNDTETAVRGYIITGEKSYLQPYTDASASIPPRLDLLLGLTADNPSQIARSRELAELATKRLAAAQQTLLAYRHGNRTAISGEINRQLDTGKADMDEIRALAHRLRAEEETLLRARDEQSRRAAQKTIVIIIVGNLVSLSFLVVSFGLLRREIANRARTENRARQIAAEYEDLYNKAPCGYHSVGRNGVFIHMNDTELAWLGYRREEVIGKLRFTDIVTEDGRKALKESFPLFKERGHLGLMGFTLVRKDGTTLPVSVSATALRDPNGEFVMSRTTVFDISELKKTAIQLESANAFLDAIVENIPSMVFVQHAETLRFARINRAEEELLGMPRSEVIGRSDHDLFPREQADFFAAKDREVLALEEVVDIQEELLSTNAGDRILHTRKIGLRDSAGKPQYLLGISHDITERKQAEERIRALATDLEARARQLEVANKELESFSYSVSHDLRSPLRAIDGFSRLLEEDYQKVLDAEGLRLLSVIRQSSRRMGALIDDLLAFSKLGRKALSVEKIDMRELVADAIEDVRAAAPANATEVSAGELPDATGDRMLLSQVWINLISNGFKYSSKKERPRVQIGSRPDENGNTVYYVRDNGVGFDMRYYDKLFGVFQRLHRIEEFPGTGVGLAIVQRVVARHGGRVWAEAQPDNGATFFFSIPDGGMT